MTDVTDLMLTYRECVRHIWNTYFRAEAEPQQDWDLRDQFYDAALILFEALVLRGLDVGDAKLLPDYSGNPAPMMFLRLEVDSSSEILVNRTGSSGYWDDPLTVVEPGDCDLRFIQFLIGGISVSETFSFTECASWGQRAIRILQGEMRWCRSRRASRSFAMTMKRGRAASRSRKKREHSYHPFA